MANFTDIEKKLLDTYIEDNRLNTSLRMIREAMENIWASDAPRIIKGYTDHGEKHCQRLIEYVDKLLEANEGNKLSEKEMYILIAGIYLHDIGMQCDISNSLAIKKIAEDLGAEFHTEFTSHISTDYSIDEQKEIRNNHQYITGAWIKYAYRNDDTIISSAIKSVEFDLVNDLIDVCMYHSKLPITECPQSFRHYQNERKKLVAALLRFADELDIDKNRVSIDTVKLFSLNIHNTLYWWIHNQTKVIFCTPKVIRLSVLLNPHNLELYGEIIKKEFVEKFETKNAPTLSVLARENIIIHIDSSSGVVSEEFVNELPIEIIKVLDNIKNDDDPLRELADEVKTWLQVIKYEIVEAQTTNQNAIDLYATIEIGTFKQRILVRCIDGEISKDDVKQLDSILDKKTPQGWLISDRRVSKSAINQTAENDSIKVFNLSDFLRTMVWKEYIDALKIEVEKADIPNLYVKMECYKNSIDEEKVNKDDCGNLEEYIDNWLLERGKMHISILGEFGTGKTWFCRYYAYYQLQRYLDNPSKERLPLLVTLRDFTKSLTAKQLINDALLEKYKLPFVGSAYEIFKEMSQRGKLLLILDGFDEMARQVDDQTVVDNFWELADNLVDNNSKVILTSRTEYFRQDEESKKILGGEYGKEDINQSAKFEVIYIKPFENQQIREVIIKKKGEKIGSELAEYVLSKRNLKEMASKPVLIELLLESLDEVDDTILENPAQVYLYSTNKLLLRNINTERTFTKTADKLLFLCELAWKMIESDELKIHYTDFPDIIKDNFCDRIKDGHELDVWDFDLRNQTLLHRNSSGYYEFAHKSLAEYFVAFKFAAELGIINPLFVHTYCEEDGNYCQELPIKTKNEVNELVNTFGAYNFSTFRLHNVSNLLVELLAPDADNKLYELIKETKNKNMNDVKYIGSNAASLLNTNGEFVSGLDLSNTILRGARLYRNDIFRANINGCDLREVDLVRTSFNETDLEMPILGNNRVLIVGIASKELIDTSEYADAFNETDEQYSEIKDKTIRNLNQIFGICCEKSGFANFDDEYLIGINFKLINEYVLFNIILPMDNFRKWTELKENAYKYKNIKRVALYADEINDLKEELINKLNVNLLSGGIYMNAFHLNKYRRVSAEEITKILPD